MPSLIHHLTGKLKCEVQLPAGNNTDLHLLSGDSLPDTVLIAFHVLAHLIFTDYSITMI